jgi:opacity protein-like surface antigen
MRKSSIATLLVLLSLFWSARAFADGVYLSVSGAAVFLEDSDLEEAGIDGKAKFDTGFGIIGAGGYAFDRLNFGTVRSEVEIAYRRNDVDEVTAFGVTFSGGDAEVSALSGMANVALDVDVWGGTVQPYMLGGIGAANLRLKSDDLDFDRDDTVFAYQVGAGLGVPVTSTIRLFVGYRFFATEDPEFDDLKAEYHSHNVEGGVILQF